MLPFCGLRTAPRLIRELTEPYIRWTRHAMLRFVIIRRRAVAACPYQETKTEITQAPCRGIPSSRIWLIQQRLGGSWLASTTETYLGEPEAGTNDTEDFFDGLYYRFKKRLWMGKPVDEYPIDASKFFPLRSLRVQRRIDSYEYI